MRPFEFKIWNSVDRQWEQGPCEYLHIGQIFELTDDGEGDVVMWTGLKDRSGVKIWEGDVVSIVGNHSEKFLVQFGEYQDRNYDNHYGFYMIDITRDQKMYRFGIGEGEIHSVIGNIYENPEILKT